VGGRLDAAFCGHTPPPFTHPQRQGLTMANQEQPGPLCFNLALSWRELQAAPLPAAAPQPRQPLRPAPRLSLPHLLCALPGLAPSLACRVTTTATWLSSRLAPSARRRRSTRCWPTRPRRWAGHPGQQQQQQEGAASSFIAGLVLGVWLNWLAARRGCWGQLVTKARQSRCSDRLDGAAGGRGQHAAAAADEHRSSWVAAQPQPVMISWPLAAALLEAIQGARLECPARRISTRAPWRHGVSTRLCPPPPLPLPPPAPPRAAGHCACGPAPHPPHPPGPGPQLLCLLLRDPQLT
jgi:hypothetical protein